MAEERKQPIEINELLKIGTRGLVFLSIGLVGYILFSFFVFSDGHLSDAPVEKEADVKEVVPEKITLLSIKDFSLYAETIKSRDIFKLPYGTKEANGASVGSTDSLSNEVAGNFKVVGIILDEEPQAIIEDLQNKDTLFLSIGQKVGTAVLEDVQEGKVIFQYNGQRLELVL